MRAARTVNSWIPLINAMALVAALALPIWLVAQEQGNLSATTGTDNPVPLINQPLLPDAIRPGAAGFTLTVNGTRFVSGAVVKWNGSARTTTFVSSSRLTANILSADIAKPTTASVTVVNPLPGGGTSNRSFFEVTTPTSAISLNLSTYGTGSGAQRSQTVVAADFNGDGKLDLAVANLYSNTVSVLMGNGDGTFKPSVDYATGLNPSSVAVGDVNRDGRLDLLVATAGGPTVGVLLGNGDGTFQGHVDYAVGNSNLGGGPDAVAAGDFNGDGKLDVVTANDSGGPNGTVSVLLGNGDGTFQPHKDYATGNGPYAVAVGDFNGDGKLDLVVANFNSGTIGILLGNGDGTFKPQVSYETGLQPFSVAVGDFNEDGKLDLAVASFYGDDVSVFLGNGDGTFKPPVSYTTGLQSVSVVVGDFNGDGKLDLAVANIVSNNVSVLLGNGDGTFRTAVDYGTGAGPVSMAVGDFNGDGRLDLAVAAGGSAVAILLQSPTVSFSHSHLAFVDQVIGSSSTPQTVTLTNTGYLTLKIATIGITGTSATDFSQSNTCGSILSPGAHCTISVTFKPTKIGPRAASVTISDNAVGSPQSIALSSTGLVSGPNATLSPTSLTFATQLVGTASAGQSVMLSNYGTMTLSISSVTASGDFTQTNTCGSGLAAGASCKISTSFKPMQSGKRTGTLSIIDDAPVSPQTVSISGTATVVKLFPASLSFSCTSSGFCDPHHGGCSAPPQTTTLTNTGRTPLDIAIITSSASNFIQKNSCGTRVAAAGSCTITVTFGTFTGDFCGVDTGAISVSDDGGGSPQAVSLKGTVKR